MAEEQKRPTDGVQFVECPFPRWEGGIRVHRYPPARLVMEWWQDMPKNPEEEKAVLDNLDKPADFWVYEMRSRFIQEWQIKGITPRHTEGDGMNMPDFYLLRWVNHVTMEIVEEAQRPFHKLKGLSPPTDTTQK